MEWGSHTVIGECLFGLVRTLSTLFQPSRVLLGMPVDLCKQERGREGGVGQGVVVGTPRQLAASGNQGYSQYLASAAGSSQPTALWTS